MNFARTRGGTTIRSEFIPTAKNAQVESFFPDRGFRPVGAAEEASGAEYRFDLSGTIPDSGEYFEQVVNEI